MGEESVLALRDKRVAIIGISNSNVPLVRFLARYGIEMTVCDRKTPEELGERYTRIARLPVTFRHGPAYLTGLDDFDVVFLSPGIRRNQPELVAARNAGVRFSSEMELFFDLCQAPVTGITGSAGKTTTTTLVAEIYRQAGYETHVGGNISHSLVDQALDFGPDSRVVLELSSFQLQPLRKSPPLAAVTNISPNHLDVHADMDEYISAKKNIFRHQKPGDRLVLNWDDALTRAMAQEAKGDLAWFSRREPVARGAYLRGDELVMRSGAGERPVCRVDEIIVPGWHNVDNILAAAAIAGAAGLDADPVRAVATTFRGVEHRLQLVRVHNDVRWFN
ncbi:MAG: UDP-N-acetylmuramoyl-L-alanine--D-glutamate ligase, partial [Chloroflexota bacterium]